MCLFCEIAHTKPTDKDIKYFDTCFALWDAYPVTPGHVLIIPYPHIPDWFGAPLEIQQDMLCAVETLKTHIDAQYAPDGYNIGLNCGAAAGQTIFHLHLHLIPRYTGDMADPSGGVRGVIPSQQKYPK